MPEPSLGPPRILPRSEHSISRAHISKSALNVLYGLHKAGYEACLVGGGVRDLLLGVTPKDFDIATSALPEQVRATFRNSRLIGRRFRLAHVHFGPEIVEVATYRASHDKAEDEADARLDGDRILRDNVYGTREEDVIRRDFTVNALYYRIEDFSLIDHVGALEDIDKRRLRTIGDPEARYREDPVRMLRAVRLAAKLELTIEPATEAPLFELGYLLETVPQARLFDETVKLLLSGHGIRSYEQLSRYRLLDYLFPVESAALAPERDRLIRAALTNTDQRVAAGLPVTPAFLIAVLLWEPLQEAMAHQLVRGVSEHDALIKAQEDVLRTQNDLLAVPKRFTLPAAEIWSLQSRLQRRRQPDRLLGHPRFRAAFDFLALRAQSEPDLQSVVNFWAARQEGLDLPIEVETDGESPDGAPPRRRRRRRGRRRGAQGASAPPAAADV
ncbi:polynucleotide adenylyltransferase PcnB [Immundisolibacter sp.]|uniref:polynucleotide adenylyltransferase PcnB n=1 Tax=Immundisolibacter sp. TaxID=1934948 RepID=UPI00199FE6E5|nr:polynucleotide adenylyltransferase PcnB [Immundisolibacter sp.]MBC7160808.1 polynucleotide adenylyltransferase PcnB [Immundisolibacter sp.]MEA3220406.1 Poly(A) polymerase I [Immundisolibacter sp.]